MTRPRILVVEDEPELAGMLERLLDEEGYQVELAADGHTALHLALTREYALLLVDRRLPAIEGLDLIARLRQRGLAVPVLVLSARGSAADRVEGLEAGAEDYLAKPFDVAELLARLRALRRRHLPAARMLPVGRGHQLDLESRVVSGPQVRVELSERECELLSLLAAHPTKVFSRADLLASVFVDAASNTVVDTYVYYLRRKVGRSVVATVHGRGYRLGAL